MLELYKTEWCPTSRRVREDLTELVSTTSSARCPSSAKARTVLLPAIGTDTIPALLLEDGSAVVGEEAIEGYLDDQFDENARGRGAPLEGREGPAPLPGGGMQMLTTSYTLCATTPLPFADAVERVRIELKTEGFGVLCEIDVQATLREKLGVEGEPYLILGACNPPLAHQALQAESDLGVLLPCNVVVYQRGGETHVVAIDPERMLSIVDNDELTAVAAEVKARLAGVVERAAAA